MRREFYVVIEKDEDGFYVGKVPGLRTCYSQGRTIDELLENIKEVILMCLEEVGAEHLPEFVGVQKVSVEWASFAPCDLRMSCRHSNARVLR